MENEAAMPFCTWRQIAWSAVHATAATVFVAWLGATGAFATEVPDTGGRVEVGGYVDGRAVVPTESSPRQRPGALADVWLDTKVTDWLRGRLDLRGAIGGPFEGANLGTYNFSDAFQNYSPSLELREAYVDVRFRNADLRLGVQSVAWGKLDGVPPTDVVNPRDFHDPLVDDFEEAKIGIPAILGSYYPPDWPEAALSQLRATLLYVPFAVPSRLPLPGERWFPASIGQNGLVVDRVDAEKAIKKFLGNDAVLAGEGNYDIPITLETKNRHPPRSLKDGGIALRLSGTWRETDWDIYHYSGPYTGPNADLSATVFGSITSKTTNVFDLQLSHADVVLTQVHDVTHMTGVDWATTFGGATVRGEAAFFLNRPYLRATDALVKDALAHPENAKIECSEGSTRDCRVTPAFDDLFPGLNSIEWGIGVDYVFHGVFPLLQLNQIIILDSAPRLLIADPETRLTALVRRAFWQDRLELEVRGVYAIERASWFVFPRVSYLLWDNLRLRLGYLAIGGSLDSLIGQFHRNDEIVFQARYSF